MSETPVSPRGLKWDGTVTAGNVLTAATLLLGLIVWGLRLEGRVDRTEDRQQRYEAASQQMRSEDRLASTAAQASNQASLRRIEDILMRTPIGTAR